MNYSTLSDFIRTPELERYQKYGGNVLTPLQSIQQSLDRIHEIQESMKPRICIHMPYDPDVDECNFCHFNV